MSEPTPRILALDLDGTLVCRDGSVHPADLAAVAAAQAIGVQVSIVTGRLYSGVRELAARLDIRGTVVCSDGAELIDPLTHRVVAHRRMRGVVATDLRDALSGPGLALFVMASDHITYDAAGAPLARYVRNWTPVMERVDSALAMPAWTDEHGISALVAVGAATRVEAVADGLRADDRYRVDSFAVHRAPGAEQDDEGPPRRGLLVHAAGVDKGRALQDLATQAGVSIAQTVAVGDWVNDIPMLRVAGRSFVMGGAEPEVTAAASDQLEARCWSGGGVAEAVRKVWGV